MNCMAVVVISDSLDALGGFKAPEFDIIQTPMPFIEPALVYAGEFMPELFMRQLREHLSIFPVWLTVYAQDSETLSWALVDEIIN